MPQVVAGSAIAAFASGFTYTAAAGLTFNLTAGAFISAFAKSLVLGSISYALQDKPKMAESGLNIGNIKEPVSPRKVIYGQTRVGGTFVFAGTSEVVWADLTKGDDGDGGGEYGTTATQVENTSLGGGWYLATDSDGNQCITTEQYLHEPTFGGNYWIRKIRFSRPMRNNEFLHFVFALAGHELTEITDVYLNEDLCGSFSGGVFTRDASYPDASGGARTRPAFFYRAGTSTQTVFTELQDTIPYDKSHFNNTSGVAESAGGWTRNYIYTDVGRCLKYQSATTQPTAFANWTDDHRCLDTALLYARLQFDDKRFETGLPKISAVVKGKSIYDPRTELSAYSNNAALCILDYLRNDKYGLGVSDDDIDMSSFISAANICDEDVSLDAGGTEKRYTINGVIDTSLTPRDVLENMLTACAGKLVYVNGQFKLFAAEYRTPDVSIDESNIIGAISVTTKNSNRSLYNAVKGSFSDPNSEPPFVATEYPTISSATYETIDGREATTELNLPFTSSSATAQRLATLMLKRSRQEVGISFRANLSAINVTAGDTIEITNARLGFSSKTFEVTSSELGVDQDGSMYMQISAMEVSSTTFDWTASDEQSIIHNSSPLYSDAVVQPPSDLSFTASTALQGDGTVSVDFDLSWTRSPEINLAGYEVQWKHAGETNYNSTKTGNDSIKGTSQVISGIEYTFRVRAISRSGAYSEWITTTATMPGDSTAPATPTGATATGGIGLVTLDWDENTEVDLKGYYVYENTTNNFGTATKRFVFADKFTSGSLLYSTTYYFWISAVDFSGNESDPTTVVSATTSAEPTAGANGDNGLSFINAYLAQSQSLSPPSFSSTTSGSAVPSGWSSTAPSVSVGEVLWYIQGRYNSSSSTIDGVAANTTEWSGPIAASVFQDIRSDNWNGSNPPTYGSSGTYGSAGYYIQRDTGNVYFNNGIFRGDITGASGTFTGSVDVSTYIKAAGSGVSWITGVPATISANANAAAAIGGTSNSGLGFGGYFQNSSSGNALYSAGPFRLNNSSASNFAIAHENVSGHLRLSDSTSTQSYVAMIDAAIGASSIGATLAAKPAAAASNAQAGWLQIKVNGVTAYIPYWQ